MDGWWCLQFFACVIIAGAVLQRLLDKLQRRLPGPVGVPVFGRLPWIIFNAIFYHHGNFYEALACDGLSYGDARFLRVGMREVVILSSADSIQEALVKQGDDFADRPAIDYYTAKRRVEFSTDGKKIEHPGGIIFSNGVLWKEHRRFALRVLRDFGMGRNLTETNVRIEVNGLVEHLTSNAGGAFNPSMSLTRAVTNIICQLVFGFRMAYNDPEVERIVKVIRQFTNSASMAVFLPIFFPFLENETFLKFASIDKYLELDQELLDYMSSKIEEVEATFSEESEPTNYIEAYLNECKLQEEENSETSLFNRQQLVISVADLFLAGTDTTTNALNWALICMASFRGWQYQVQEELDRELGACLEVSYADRLRCPVTQAVLDEVQRFCTLIPHNVDKAVLKETWFRGCRISPHSMVIADIKSSHYDPRVWAEPHRFDPRRFLNDEGAYQPSKQLMPFSVGKRMCLGESLARVELFIFFSSLMLRFDVDMDEETRSQGDKLFLGSDGTIHAPKDHKLIFHKR